METVAHLFSNRAQCRLFASQLVLQEFPTPSNCRWKMPGRACQESAIQVRNGGRSRCVVQSSAPKRRPSALRPLAAVTKTRRSGPAWGASLSASRINPRPSQFFQRIINLWPRDARPIPHLPALQLHIRLVSMHRAFSQQTQQYQVRSRQLPLVTGCHRAPFVDGSSTTTGIAPAANEGCALAPPPHEKRQGNKCPAPGRSSGKASRKVSLGFCRESCPTVPIPSSSKSRNIAGPIETRSCSLRSSMGIHILLDIRFSNLYSLLV